MEPGEAEVQPLAFGAQRAVPHGPRQVSEATYFRWSSIMQLASSVAVGLAMFLLAILLPVFLVAWKGETEEAGWKHSAQSRGPTHTLRPKRLHPQTPEVGGRVPGPGESTSPSEAGLAGWGAGAEGGSGGAGD